jgi:hypothetical protein
MFARNMEAFKAFQQRKIDGFTVSDRVWKAVEGAKENLEFYLSSGISTGRPAASIAVDIRQLLQNPERRFRRVRNEEGKLVLSKPMQDYHPGQGVYRSSYMNALRIAATETNMSYHSADYERWKKQGFVLGIEVSRSKSNKGPCDICDPMVGRYPKDYRFIGNHPWCICVAVPVMLEGEEFIDYLLTGKVPEEKIIKTVPQSAIDFVNEKASHRDNLFVKENSRFFAGDKPNNAYDFQQIKNQRVEIRDWAKISLVDKNIKRPEIDNPIRFSMSGIKEALNQPHKYLLEKNKAIQSVEYLINNADYVRADKDAKGRNFIYHYLKIKIKGEDSFIVLRENTFDGKVYFFSIVDKIKNR